MIEPRNQARSVMPSYSSDRGPCRGTVKLRVRYQGSPGVEEQRKAVKGFPGKLGEPTVCPSANTGRVRPVKKTQGLVRSRHEDSKNSEIDGLANPKKKGEAMDRGSLSICVVAIESRETIPREPVSSQGGCRVVELLPETRARHRARIERVTQPAGDSIGDG